MNWHSLPVTEVTRIVETDLANGLSDREAHRRIKEKGGNELPRGKSITKLQILLSQFYNPLILILVGAGGITIFLNDVPDAIIIGVTIAVNTAFGYFQELKTSKILETLKKTVKTKAFVRRDGEEREILQEGLTVGDIVILKAGLKVPADVRITRANELKMNESSLTGEWMPTEKDTDPVLVDNPISQRSSLAYMGTIVESGEGEAVIVAIGKETEIGKIAEATESTKEEKTPYQKELDRLSKLIGVAVVVIVSIIFIEGLIVGTDPREIFLISVAIAVAAIPEGLPMAMSVILTVGSQQILKKKGLIRRLASAETLGSTDVILTDKTGTLTEARMKVSGIYAGKNLLKGEAEHPEEGKLSFCATATLKSAVLSNEAFIENFDMPVEKWIIRGRSTERAIVEAGIKAGLIKREIEKEEPKVEEIVFSSEWRYSAVLHMKKTGERTIYSMGAPEAILEKSAYIAREGNIRPMTGDEKAEIGRRADELAALGMRVVATAYKEADHQKLDRDLSDMVFSGLITFSDPIRSDVFRALQSCRSAGILPVIVTGDNALTAKNIANSLGFDVKDENIMDGAELEKISDEELLSRIESIKIFARVAPIQKLRIVSTWQNKGKVVAMTGDGVNDAPAIKKADIGIALGSGTDAAKEAADFVLLDDSFVVIETAIEEGRKILDNIQKVATYLLSDSFAEILIVGAALFIGLPIPVTAAQILWVNLIEDGLPNIALALEPKEKGIMLRKPNGRKGSLLSREMIGIILAIGIITGLILVGAFIFLSGTDIETDVVRTIIFAMLAVNSLFYSFSCKNLRKNIWEINIFSNKLLIFAILFGIIALFAAIYVPVLNVILGTVPISASFWPAIIGVAVINVILIEAAKFYFVRRRRVS